MESPGLVDLGEQRLKDLAIPERVFQLGDHDFGALRASGALTVRLPEWGTRFWGRADELDRLTESVPRTRVVVLTGPGGLGKTRLAAQVAERLVGVFRDGVGFVGLAGIAADDTDYVIAEGIGVRREPGRSTLESVISWVDDREILLVLDNCEEAVAAARQAVQQLVAACRKLHVLVTSRVPLGVAGEVRMPLRPLDDASAIGLFVDRLRGLDPAFDAERDTDASQELCRRLDGVPLAVELAAARCRTLTPAQLLVRLERRPGLLADTSGVFDDRHRDLDRLIEWSWDGLSPLAQSVLARLTTIIGSFTLDTAEAIGAAGTVDERDVDDALEEIEDAGLIIRERVGRDDRHHLLEPIRQHVEGKLDERERRESALRHAHWFSDLAADVKAGSIGPDFGRWADLAEADLANFREAHRLLVEARDTERAVAIVDGLSVVAAERGLIEIVDWCDATVALAESRGDRLEVAALAAATRLWHLQNRTAECVRAASRASELSGDAAHHLVIEDYAVRATLDPNDWSAARARLREALPRYDPEIATWEAARTAVYQVLLLDADASLVEGIARRFDSAVLSEMLVFYRAVPFYMNGDERSAVPLAEQAVELARATGASYSLANNLMGQGGWRASFPEASISDVFGPLAESLDLWDRLRMPWGRVAVIEEIAQALAIRGHPEAAFVLWATADASPIQAPSKVGRVRHAGASIANVSPQAAASWSAHGRAMSLDQALTYARLTVAALLA